MSTDDVKRWTTPNMLMQVVNGTIPLKVEVLMSTDHDAAMAAKDADLRDRIKTLSYIVNSQEETIAARDRRIEQLEDKIEMQQDQLAGLSVDFSVSKLPQLGILSVPKSKCEKAE